MPLNYLDIIFIIINYIIPFAVISGLIIFVIRKLNHIDKKVNRLEKLINEKIDKTS